MGFAPVTVYFFDFWGRLMPRCRGPPRSEFSHENSERMEEPNMDGRHPESIDPRPKRRKDKYNPYKIFTTGIDTPSPHYYLCLLYTSRCV